MKGLWVFAVIFVVFVVRFEVVAGFVLVEDMVAVVTAADIVLSVVISRLNLVGNRLSRNLPKTYTK